MADISTIIGDCAAVVPQLLPKRFDLIYMDPPFFTQRRHTLSTRDGDNEYSFRDFWTSDQEYYQFLKVRLHTLSDALSETGSLFFHCDKSANHIARFVLDEIFGPDMFQSEIIWTYRRWSNSAKALLPAHQNILFYSKSRSFKFNMIFDNYSAATNIDQIVQKRTRDGRNKSVYARDDSGAAVSNGAKRGVPLSDVWDIPYLNPKARERVGYPTQKPVILLERIIQLVTDEDDWILDPFCGSGTTLVASKLLERNAVGIDSSEDAIKLTTERVRDLVRTGSGVLTKGRSQYLREDCDALSYLHGIPHFVVQRNGGMDAILKQEVNGRPVFVRVQRPEETLQAAGCALLNAAKGKGEVELLLVATNEQHLALNFDAHPVLPPNFHVVKSTSLAVNDLIACLSRNAG